MKRSKLLMLSSAVPLLLSSIVYAKDTHEAASAAGEHGGSSFPPFDPTTFAPTLFWLFVTFALLYWLMSSIALPRIAGVIEDRNARITRDVDIASALQKKAEDAGTAYETALTKAKSNAAVIGQQSKDEAVKNAAVSRAQVEADMSVKIADAETKIAATKSAAMNNVSAIASDSVAAIVTKLTGITPTADAVAKAVAAHITV